MMNKTLTYQIADVNIRVQIPEKYQTTAIFQSFLYEGSDYTYDVQMSVIDILPFLKELPVYEDWKCKIFQNSEGKFFRFFCEREKQRRPYAISFTDREEKKISIQYLQGAEHFFATSDAFFLHVGFESLMLNEGCLILHASFIQTEYGGILFSGPSGIGKSTQAGLWCQYANARLLNGDRPILRKKEEKWYAYGSPYAGSSRCCVNENCPVRVIVLLKQSEECKVRYLNRLEKFQRVFSGLTVNSWDPKDLNRACDLTIALISEVEVIELSCTPNAAAVELLQKELMKGEQRWIPEK